MSHHDPENKADILQESLRFNACLLKVRAVGVIIREVVHFVFSPFHWNKVKSCYRDEVLRDGHSIAWELNAFKQWLINHYLLTVQHAPDFAHGSRLTKRSDHMNAYGRSTAPMSHFDSIL